MSPSQDLESYSIKESTFEIHPFPKGLYWSESMMSEEIETQTITNNKLFMVDNSDWSKF